MYLLNSYLTKVSLYIYYIESKARDWGDGASYIFCGVPNTKWKSGIQAGNGEVSLVFPQSSVLNDGRQNPKELRLPCPQDIIGTRFKGGQEAPSEFAPNAAWCCQPGQGWPLLGLTPRCSRTHALPWPSPLTCSHTAQGRRAKVR